MRRITGFLGLAAVVGLLLSPQAAWAQSNTDDDVASDCGPAGPAEPVTVLDANRLYTLLAGGGVSDDDYRVFDIDWGDGTTETLDNRLTDEDGARIATTAFHTYEADGEFEVTATLIEGNSASDGVCAAGSATWTVVIDSSATSEIPQATIIGSGAALENARFEGQYTWRGTVTGIQDPDGQDGGGYGPDWIGTTVTLDFTNAVPQCADGPCDTTYDVWSTADPRLYTFDGTSYRKFLTWGEIPGGEGSPCPDDLVAEINELQVVDAIVVGDRTIATELTGVSQNYTHITSECVPFPTYSEAWTIRLSSTSLAALLEEQAQLDAEAQAAEVAQDPPEPADDPSTEEPADGGAEDDVGAGGDGASTGRPADSEPGFDEGRSNFVASVPTLDELPTAAADLAASALIALAVVALIVFPSVLFNSTFSAHYDDIVAGTRRRVPWLFRLFPVEGEPTEEDAGRGPFEGMVGKVLAAIAAAAVLKAFLDPQVGLNKATLLTVLGFLSALAIYMAVATVIGLRLGRSLGRDDAYFKLLPGSLLIGLICVIISRSVGFLPGYLYVFVGSLTFREKLDDDGNARNAATVAVTLMLLGIAGWLLLGPVANSVESAEAPGVGALWLEAALAATFGVGIHSALFRMIPITFMAGHKIWSVSRVRWVAIYAPVVFLFVHIGGQRAADTSTVDWVATVSLFVFFGLVSGLFWAYWRERDRRAEREAVS